MLLSKTETLRGHKNAPTKLIFTLCALSLLFLVSGCGDDSSVDTDTGDAGAAAAIESDTGEEASDTATDAAADDAAEQAAPAEGGRGGGQLILGDETITLDSAFCHFEPQPAAAGGGQILFVAQASGTNAAGEEVLIDVSRFDQDSQFHGDSIVVDIGDIFAGESISWSGDSPIDTVAIDGSSVSATNIGFSNLDEFTETTGSFEINC